MTQGKYVIDLASLIPSRNINFHIDACRAMSLMSSAPAIAGRKMGPERTTGGGAKAGPQAVLEDLIGHVQTHFMGRLTEGMKLAGYLLLDRVRENVFKENDRGFANYPFHFLCFAVLDDLRLHGQARSGFLVEKFLDELAELEIIDPCFRDLFPREHCLHRYSMEHIAVLFLGSSLAARGALLPLVPFPAVRSGFVARLISESATLLPCGAGGAFLDRRRRCR